MNTIEEKLWNYIDGTCSMEEHDSISKLIASDEVYKQKYEELLLLNAEFASMEMDEPSMAFTYNVMEAIRTENALQPLKAAINKRIIWGIVIFFAVAVSALFIFMLSQMNWSTNSTASAFNINFTMPDLSAYFNGNLVKGFIFVDVILTLFLLDHYLRKKLSNGVTH